MTSIDDEWTQFLLQFGNGNSSSDYILNNKQHSENQQREKEPEPELEKTSNICPSPMEYIRNTCESLYISTQTKIFFLNVNSLDVDTIFWDIPIMEYGKPEVGIIKKQMRMIFKTPEEYEDYLLKIKEVSYYSEKIIKQINNPNARKIKFKDERKLTIGISKKDIMNCHGKEKKAFINCFAMILRIPNKNNIFHEVHVKVFNTGKITIPGIVDDDDVLLEFTKQNILNILQPNVEEKLHLIPEEEIPLLKKIVKNQKGKSNVNQTLHADDEVDTTTIMPKNSHIEYIKQQSGVLINSNFNCGFYIDQMKLMHILKEKYKLEPTYNKSNYPGVKCKFYLNNELPLDINVQTGRIEDMKHDTKYTKINFVVFRTGNNLILGNFSKKVLLFIFEFVKHILMTEYVEIRTLHDDPIKKIKKNKPRKKTIYFTKDYMDHLKCEND
jgi:hypothetical protein